MEWPGRQMVTCRRQSSGHVASIDERLLANCHKLHLKVTKKMMMTMILNALLWYTHTHLESYSCAETKSCTFSRVNQWLDYGNSMLVGIPAYLTRRLQSVLNAVTSKRISWVRGVWIHTVLCSQWPNKNVFMKRLYDKSGCLRSVGRLFQTWGLAAPKALSPN